MAESENGCRIQDISSSVSYDIQCSKEANKLNCSRADRVGPGTEAKIVCRTGYEFPNGHDEHAICQENGTWSRQLEPCKQVCGVKDVSDPKVPWHVGIYRTTSIVDQPRFVCGGTILNAKIIISAVHCFWDTLRDRAGAVEQYRVVAGKFYKQYNDPQDKDIQTLKVAKIHYPEEYQHIVELYANNIAVIVVDRYIEFTSHIAPICIEYNEKGSGKISELDYVGHVAGWGIEQLKDKASNELKFTELVTISRSKCRRDVGVNLFPFLTNDKFCAHSEKSSDDIYLADSGSGLVSTTQTIGSKAIYYLRGVISIGSTYSDFEDNSKYVLLTNVAKHKEFIQRFDVVNSSEIFDADAVREDAEMRTSTVSATTVTTTTVSTTTATTTKASETTTAAAARTNTGKNISTNVTPASYEIIILNDRHFLFTCRSLRHNKDSS